jgi:hypothetical protein
MRTFVQQKALRRAPRVAGKGRSDADFEAWDKTDRLLRYPGRGRSTGFSASAEPLTSDSLRARWQLQHDVHTEFVDVGFGCCWFAYQGDQEPVNGETEIEAIARLARCNGLKLWGEAGSKKQTVE